MITLCCILSAHKASQFAGRQLGGSKILLVVGGHMLTGVGLGMNCLLQANSRVSHIEGHLVLCSSATQLRTHMGEMGPCLILGPIFGSVNIRDGGQKILGGSVCWGHNNTPARGNASLVALLNI